MSFSLKLGDVYDLSTYLTEIVLENPNSDGYLRFVAHPGGVRKSSSSSLNPANSKILESPDSAPKINSLLRVLNSFDISQLNDNLKIYFELVPSLNRTFEYSVFILTDLKFVIIVCDQYGEAIRFKKYDDHFTLESIISEISINYTKGELDSVGFSKVSMTSEAYNLDSCRELFFEEFLLANAFVDNSVAQSLVANNSLDYKHLMYSELVLTVKEFFNDEYGYFDISKVSTKNIRAFQADIIRFSQLSRIFNVEKVDDHVRWDKFSSVFQILKSIYYNCHESLNRLNNTEKPRLVKISNLDQVKSLIYNFFSDGNARVDLSKISFKTISDFKEHFGYSFDYIAKQFVFHGRNITTLVNILQQIFLDEVSQQRLNNKLSEITVLTLSNHDLFARLRDHFTDDNDMLDISKLGCQVINNLSSDIGVSFYLAFKQIMPIGTSFTGSIENLIQFLEIVFKDSPHNLKLITDYRDQKYPDCDIQESVDNLKKELSDEFGVFDLSISLTPIIQNFHSLFGITTGTFISFLNEELPISRFDTPSGFLPVLKYLYSDCTKSLNKIDSLESRLSKEVISDEDLIVRIKNHFSEGDFVSDKKLSHDNVRSLHQEIGIGAQAIFTRFERQSDNANSITEFLPFLLDLFVDCSQSVNTIQAKIIKINSRT